jgi:exopolysaccharide biosynthesis polyprenyl glycosylphosphotransferase
VFKERAKTLNGISSVLDVVCLCLAFGTGLLLRAFHESIPLIRNIPVLPFNAEPTVRSDYAALLLASLLAWVIALRRSGVYASHRAERLVTVMLAYLRALVWAGLSTAAVVFALKLEPVSRLFFVYYFVFGFVFLTLKQALVIGALRALRERGYNLRHALVIGAGKPASWFARVLLEARHTGYRLVGLVLPHEAVPSDGLAAPVLGTPQEIDEVLDRHEVDEVFVVGGANELAQLSPVTDTLIRRGKVVSIVSVLHSGLGGVRGRVTEFAGVPMISYGPMPRDEINAFLKRAVDVIVASVGLLIAMPLMAAIAVAIRILDRGPALFRQVRLGEGGRPFQMWKFRTMRTDAEEVLLADPELYARYVANNYKLADAEDPRISRIGAFLRKTSLDELPQLVNVLKGDMTLVGPRPIVPRELEMYAPYHDLLLSVRPGLTGQWQVNGRSEVPYPERAHMDLDYVAGHSVGEDIAIMVRTLPSVVRRRGAH